MEFSFVLHIHHHFDAPLPGVWESSVGGGGERERTDESGFTNYADRVLNVVDS